MNDTLELADVAALEPAVRQGLQVHYPAARKAMLNAPGLVSIAGERGYYPGCRLIRFHCNGTVTGLDEESDRTWMAQTADQVPCSAESAINRFFEIFGNVTIVDWRIEIESIYCIITNQLEQDDLEDMQFAAAVVERAMQEHRDERAAKRAEAQAAERAAAAELERLADLGRKYENNIKKGKP